MKQLVTLLFLFASINFSQDFWEPTNGPQGSGSLRSIRHIALNSNHEKFIATDKGIYRCANDFETCERLLVGFFDKLIVNSSDMVFAKGRNNIMRSIDSGENWTEINTGLTFDNSYDRIFAVNSTDQIFIGSYRYGIFRSDDNGDSWIECNPEGWQGEFNTAHIDNINNIIYWAINDSLFFSEDNGDSWSKLEGVEGWIFSIATTPEGDLYIRIIDGKPFGAMYKYSLQNESWLKLTEWPYGDIYISPIGDIFIVQGDETFRSVDNGNTWIKVYQGHVSTITFDLERELLLGDRGGLYHSTDNGDNWTEIISEYISPAEIYCMDNTADNKIIVGDYSGEGIFISKDRGNNWQKENGGLPNYVTTWSMLVTTKGDIFIGVDDPDSVGIFRSIDNGASWEAKSNGLPYNTVSGCLTEISDSMILYGTWGDGVYLSTNYGENWVQKSEGLSLEPNHLYVYSAALFDDSNIFIGTNKGVYHSADNCESWKAVNNGIPTHDNIGNPIEINIFSISKTLDDKLIVGSNQGIFLSVDKGQNWIAKNSGLPDDIIISCIINPSEEILFAGSVGNDSGWRNGDKQNGIFYSSDNGDNWNSMSEGLLMDNYYYPAVWSLLSDSEGYLYAGTYENGIYRSLNPIPVGIENNSSYKFLTEYDLSQNYPNPFNPVTTIKYSIPTDLRYEYQDVRLIVYDVLGREVATLVNEKQKPGNYEVDFDASDLTSGIYYYKLNAGDYTETKKMILLK